MFIPVVFDISPDTEARYLSEFYRWLSVCKRNSWLLMATEEYFFNPEYYINKGRREAFDILWAQRGGYNLPLEEDFDLVQTAEIPSDMIAALAKKCGSYSDATVFLFKNRYEFLEVWLEDAVKKVEEQGNMVEAFIMFRKYPSFECIAQKYGIRIIYYDIGAFRPEVYSYTALIDFQGLFGNTAIEKRYRSFRNELNDLHDAHITMLSKKEILALFLEPYYLKYLRFLGVKGRYKIGLGLQSSIFYPFYADSYINNLDIICEVFKAGYQKDDILMRTHPYDIIGGEYNWTKLKRDTSTTPLEFILKCDKIVSVGSNLIFEAMLWGKKTYAIGKCPYVFKTNCMIDEENEPEDEFLNFVCFNFFIPYELLSNEEYLRWRLELPSEFEIYRRNLEYYFNKIGLTLSQKNRNEISTMIIEAKGINVEQLEKEPVELSYDDIYSEDIKSILSEYIHLKEKIKYYEKHVEALEENIRITDNYVKSLEKAVDSQKQYISNLEAVQNENM